MNYFDHAGWILAVSLIVSIVTYLLGRKHGSNNCGTCGITGLNTKMGEATGEISRLCNLIETLWEKAGLTVKERLEIENLEK